MENPQKIDVLEKFADNLIKELNTNLGAAISITKAMGKAVGQEGDPWFRGFIEGYEQALDVISKGLENGMKGAFAEVKKDLGIDT